MSAPVDRFYAYLEYCENVELIGIGDYVELVARGEVLAWSRLMRDVMDTYRAGGLVKVRTGNGSAAYVRETYYTQMKNKHTGKEPQHGNVRQGDPA
jgi:hypothetical protein